MKSFARTLLVLAVSVCAVASLNAQAVNLTWGFENPSPQQGSSSNTSIATAGNAAAGAGLAAVSFTASGNPGQGFSATGFSTTIAASITNNDYVEFSVTAANCSDVTINAVSFSAYKAGGQGVNLLDVRASSDSYVSSRASFSGLVTNTWAASGTLTFGMAVTITGGNTVTFRIYGQAGQSSQGLRLDNVVFSGTGSSTGPDASFTVSGGGSFCTGTGPTITLSDSETGVNYELWVDALSGGGSNPTGVILPGTGSALNFTNVKLGGTYTVVGTRTSDMCSATMSGSVDVTPQFNLVLETVSTISCGGEITVKVKAGTCDIFQMTGLQYSITWDNTKFQYVAASATGIAPLTGPSVGPATITNSLRYSWISASMTGSSISAGAELFEFKLKALIPSGSDDISLANLVSGDLEAIQSNGYVISIPNSPVVKATVAIAPSVTINVNSVTVDEGDGNAVFTVSLSAATGCDVTFDAGTSDIDAIAGSDYTAVPNPVGGYTIPAGQTSITISVPITDDNLVEPTETFNLTISNVVNAITGTLVGVGTITDNDAATLAIGDVTVNEGDGTATFVVTLTGTVQNNFTVNYATADGTAEEPDDYTLTGGTLTFGGANSNTQNVVVPIIDDVLIEPTENFFVNLSGLVTNGQSVTISDAQGEGTITDNDAATLAIGDVTVNEGDGTATFVVTLTGTVQNNFTVNYATADGTAEEPNDYTLTGGTLTFGGANSNTQNVVVPIIDDVLIEPTENFFVNLSGLVTNGQSVTISDAQGEGTITDNDAATLAIGDVTVNEGDGTATFVVTLTGTVQNNFTVNYATADGTAEEPDDYTLTGGTLTFGGANSNTQNVVVPIIDDVLIEPTENFFVNLSGLVTNGQSVTISDAQGEGTITDNDAATLAIGDVTVNEGDGTATFVVTLTGTVQNNFTVNYATADGTAEEPDDYTLTGGTLTFGGANSNTQNVVVPIIDDVLIEPTENFFVNLSGLVTNGQSVTISDAQGEGRITDNDAATLAIGDVTVNEGDGTATFVVTLTGTVQNNFTVNYATADGTAEEPDDYTLTGGTLTFGGANSNTQNVVVPIIDDVLIEPTENFFVNLSGLVTNGQSVTISDAQGEGTITDNDAATLAIGDVTVNEGDGTATFVVTLTGTVQNNFTVNYATADGTAEEPNDYTLTGGTLTFGGANSNTQNVVVPIIDDVLIEPTENFFVNLSGLVTNGQSVTISDAQGEGTITDNDAATLAIGDVTVNEGDGTATFVVTLTGTVQNNFTVNYATADDTAEEPDDYTLTGGTLTFGGANSNTQNVVVPIIDDVLIEPTENFFVNLSGLVTNGQSVTISDAQGEGTITDNDAATLAIGDVTVNEGDGTATFVVTLTGTVQNNFTVNYATADGTAEEPDDYTLTGGTLTFGGANSNTQNVVVPIIDDVLIEPTENFFVNLSGLVTNGQSVTISDAQGEGTITDNDAATLAIGDVTVNEGDGTATFVVTLTGTVQNNFTVNYATADGTAEEPDDYTLTGGTLTFGGANSNTQNVVVPIIDDVLIEPTENFFVNLSGLVTNGQSVTISDAQGEGTITDNDAATLAIGDVTVNEGDGTATFVVTLTGTVQNNFTVNYATADGTAEEPDDYTLTGGTLTFGGANSNTQNVVVPIIDDVLIEPTENFFVNLSGLVTNGQSVTISDAQGEGTITDNDAATLAIGDVTVNEGDGTATFVVTLTGTVQNNFTVNYATADGTAEEPDDYTLTGGTLTFGGANSNTQNVVVPIIDDVLIEPTENFFVNLSGLVTNGQSVTISDAQGEGTITDNDAATLAIGDVTVNEGDGTATFVVTLTGTVQNNFTVNYATADGTAEEPDDYTLTGGTLTFGGANSNTQNVVVPIIDDVLIEPTENFFVNLSGLVTNGQSVTISDAQGIGTITDNDAATLAIGDVTVNEGDGTATFVVTLTGTVQNNFTVNYATADGTAEEPDDYTLTGGTLTFGGANSNTQNVVVPIIDDVLIEPTENFFVNLSGLVTNGQSVTISDAQGEGTITDNDAATLAIGDVTVNEGDGTATFVVTLTGTVQNNFTVNYATADGTAEEPDDYTLTGGTLTFGGANSNTQNVVVPIIDDVLIEPTENFFVNLSGLVTNGQSVTISDAQGEGTITDNDAATLAIGDVTVNEGDGTATFVVTLTGTVQNNFTVNYATADGTAEEPDDYTLTGGTLTFGGANSNTQNVVVPIIDDVLIEPTENFFVNLSGLVTNGQSVTISDAQGEGTITDNDNATASINPTTQASEPATNGEFTVTLSELSSTATIVSYTVTGTATPGVDYTALSGTVTIPANTLSATIAVSVIDDSDVETGGETVIVTLTGTDNPAIAIAASPEDEAIVNIDDDDFYTISGKLTWRGGDGTSGIGVGLATVTLTGPPNDAMVTASDGLFSLQTNAAGSYTIKPEKHIFIPPNYTSLLNGLDVGDATAIQQHLTGINPIIDPYRLVAADANKSYTLSTLDATVIRQALLFNPGALAILNNTKSWRFIPSDYTLTALTPYSLPVFPETRTASVSADLPNQDFWGVKVGDVLETGIDPANLGGLTLSPLLWVLDDRMLEAGETVEVEFKAVNFDDLAAFQFALGFDPQHLEYMGVEVLDSGLPLNAEGNFGTSNIQNGELRVAYAVSTGQTLEALTPVFKVTFTALNSGYLLSELLQLDLAAMSAVAYTSGLEITAVKLEYKGMVTSVAEPGATKKAQLLQNRPNPFARETTVGFVLPEACDAQLRVFDVNGIELLRINKTYGAGYHEESLSIEKQGGGGLLFCELTTPHGVAVLKMMAAKN